MIKTITDTEYIQWAQDNYHQLVGPNGSIKAIWHPVVRKEMRRLRVLQMRRFKEILQGKSTALLLPKQGGAA